MKTKKLLILFPAVFAIVSILVSCNSVGFCQEKPSIHYSQKIVTPDGSFCVDLDPFTQCPKGPKAVKDCKTQSPIDGIDREKFDAKIQDFKFKYIVGSTCNSFIADVEGNTTYYCTPWKCYPR